MEPSSKKSPPLDDNCIDKQKEVAELIPDIMQQVSDKQAEETKPSQDSTEVSEVPTEECQLPPIAPDTITKMPETFVLVNKEIPSFRKEEQLEARTVPESAEGGNTPENYETSSLPASESCATDSSPSGEKSLKSPAETYSSFPSSVEINKTSVSSSPAASLELGFSHDVMRSQASLLESSATLPATYVSFTPKIGMGKPAITKRKFSPGRPRSRQVSML